MEKLPYFASFKKMLMKRGGEIKDGWNNKEWGYLAAYFLLVAIFLIPAFGFILAGTDNLISITKKYLPTKSQLPYEPKTLTYNRLEKNKKDSDNLYHNLFEIFIHNPGGNTDPRESFVIGLGKDVECEYGSETGLAEIGPGLASTTKRILMACVTKEPVLDNGKLFTIVN